MPRDSEEIISVGEPLPKGIRQAEGLRAAGGVIEAREPAPPAGYARVPGSDVLVRLRLRPSTQALRSAGV